MTIKTFVIMTILSLCLAACNDEEQLPTVADSVVGTYRGTLDMTVAGNSAGSSNLSVVISKTSDATISVAIVNEEGAATEGMSIGRIEIDNITVTEEENSTYKLLKTVPEEGFTATDTGSASQTVWTFKSFSGSIENGTLNLNMEAQPGAMPMPITMVFVGSK